MTITNILSSIDAEIASLQKACTLLSDGSANKAKALQVSTNRPKKKMNAAGRKRIADAQRKR